MPEILTPLTWAIAAFGGWTVVVGVLVVYLGDRFTKRALQNEQAAISKALAAIGHELKLSESSYGKHVDLILDYYAVFYRHYRLCQSVANQDAWKQPDGSVVKTRESFFEQLDTFLSDFREREGRIRLVLPEHLLELHEKSIAAFNEFKNAAKRNKYDDEYRRAVHDAFLKVINIKASMESGIRNFLRTEHLLKGNDRGA